MTQRTLSSLQRLFVTGDRRLALAVTVALCLAAGLVAGAYMAAISPLYAIAGLLALAAGLLMLRDTQWGLLATVALICLLPFGALPFKIGFTPTFLDLAFIATYLVWIVRIATGKSGKLIGTQLGLPIIVFLLLACASFVAGLAHAYLSQYVLRHFVEILLSIGLFFVVVNCIQTAEQLRFWCWLSSSWAVPPRWSELCSISCPARGVYDCSRLWGVLDIPPAQGYCATSRTTPISPNAPSRPRPIRTCWVGC